jgi:hypothetical protein
MFVQGRVGRPGGKTLAMGATAKRAAIVALVAGAMVVCALALWKIKLYVLLAIPITAVLATLLDVVARDVDPAEQEVPPVLFPGAREEARWRITPCASGRRRARRA